MLRYAVLQAHAWGMRYEQCNGEGVIGRSKIRYKTIRGYKSIEGMMNGLWLPQRVGGESGVDMDEPLVA